MKRDKYEVDNNAFSKDKVSVADIILKNAESLSKSQFSNNFKLKDLRKTIN